MTSNNSRANNPCRNNAECGHMRKWNNFASEGYEKFNYQRNNL